MSSPNVVGKIQFIEYGKSFPKGSSKKGIVSTASLIGFQDYSAREVSRGQEITTPEVSEGGFLEYSARTTSRDNEEVKTFTNRGWVNTDEERLLLREDIRQAFYKDGQLAWQTVLSFKDYLTAEEYSLFRDEDYAAVISQSLPKFFKKANLDADNMIWFMDYHTNKAHPHIHLTFLEKEQTRAKGTFTKEQVNAFKGSVWNVINNRREMLLDGVSDSKELFQKKDVLFNNVRDVARGKIRQRKDLKLQKDIMSFYRKLSEDNEIGNRLQYNSSHMIKYRDQLDKIVDQVLAIDEVSTVYDDFKNSCQELDRIKSANLNTTYKNITDAEDKKLRIQIANSILQSKKDYSLRDFAKEYMEGHHVLPKTINSKASYNTRNNNEYNQNLYSNAKDAKIFASSKAITSIGKITREKKHEIEEALEEYYNNEGRNYEQII